MSGGFFFAVFVKDFVNFVVKKICVNLFNLRHLRAKMDCFVPRSDGVVFLLLITKH